MIAIRADLLDFPRAPAWGDTGDAAARFRPDHWLFVGADGRIVGAEPGAVEPGPDWQREEHPGRVLMPGFIDTHVHSAQLAVIASHGTELLQWLDRYTFPAEQAFADEGAAAAGAEHFLDLLVAHGSTAACVYPTVHRTSAEALFAAAARRRLRIITGKVLMDRHAPPALTDDVAGGERDTRALIERWHGRGRAAYAVTIRFAPTSTPEQLAMAGRLLAEDPSLYFQTHVAENRDEVAWVHALYPDARSYLDVYTRAGLVHRRSIFAHGIWLDDHDRALLAERGAQVAHCPSSNLFLGSGLMDWPELQAAGVRVSTASDVGGGTSLSMLRTLGAAYSVQALRGHRLTAWTALHAATQGAAEALELDGEVGSLEPGRMADLCLWDWGREAGDRGMHAVRQRAARDLHERAFAWMILGDERQLEAVWVAGVRQELHADGVGE